MKRTKKFLGFVLGIGIIASSGLATACDIKVVSDPKPTLETVYAKVQELGYQGTLEEFLETVKGNTGIQDEKEEFGANIQEIYVNKSDELFVLLTDGTFKNLGKVLLPKDNNEGYWTPIF